MQKIGKFQDDILGQTPYDLYACKLSEIKSLILQTIEAKGDKKTFDPNDYDHGQQSQRAIQHNKLRVPSFYHNNFIVVQGLEDRSPWLLDGFTRLFITSELVNDPTVFVKSYSKDLRDDTVMHLFASLNFWKCEAYKTSAMFDRGFTLYTYMKTGYNIKEHITKVSFYLDARMSSDYRYDFNFHIDIQEDLLFKNPHFFKDIVTICKLSDLTFNACLDKKPYVRGHKDIPYAVPFYQIISMLRIVNMAQKTDLTIDTEDATHWIEGQPELKQLAIDHTLAHNSTGQINTRTKSKEIFWNKYVLPIVLKREGQKTEEEKKEEFRKMASKEKNKYKKITYEELSKEQPGLEVFEIHTSYPTLKVHKKTYLGHRLETCSYTQKIGLQANRKTFTETDTVFLFKVEGPEGQEETKETTVFKYQLKDTVLVLKAKKA